MSLKYFLPSRFNTVVEQIMLVTVEHWNATELFPLLRNLSNSFTRNLETNAEVSHMCLLYLKWEGCSEPHLVDFRK